MSTSQLPTGLTKALDEFDQWVQLRKKAYEVQFDRPVFHYTGANGLTGILTSDTLWFTDIRCLNDPSEFHFGRDLALDALKSEAEHAGADPLVRVFCERMLSGLDSALQQFAMFVGSFSKNADELSQWRGYADNGRGFCIGFSKRILEETDLQADPLKNAFIIAISYDAERVKQEQHQGVAKAVGLLRRPNVRCACEGTAGICKLFLQQLSVVLAKWIYFVAVGFKHPAYATEEEIRLLLINEKEKLQRYIRTRVRTGELVPYIPWPCLPSLRQEGVISEIRTGPAAPPSAEDAVVELLRSLGISTASVKFERSRIPYRAL